jgi:23S rRNA pseudouridine1911/1915/1917 synthase
MTGTDGQDRGDDILEVTVPPSLAGERLDRSVSMLAGVTRSVAADLVAQGRIVLDGQPVARRADTLSAGQRLQITLPAAESAALVPDDSVEFAVVYEDAALVVVDKPPGLVVHQGAGHHHGTLVQGLVARYPDLAELAASGAGGDPSRPGIVHRLDKGTSGLLVVARTADAYRMLAAQFKEHSTTRTYRALVAGSVAEESGVVDAPIGRSVRRPTRMAVRSEGRPARTRFQVLEHYRGPLELTLLDVTLETGRTHQARVHLAAIGHPVIGDDRYGGPVARPADILGRLEAGRVLLHARRLTLVHPDGAPRTWESPLPADMTAVLSALAN